MLAKIVRLVTALDCADQKSLGIGESLPTGLGDRGDLGLSRPSDETPSVTHGVGGLPAARDMGVGVLDGL
jgi:hypothetical protein